MTDWIEHTTDTCPVDPDTVVEVVLRGDRSPEKRTKKAKDWWWVNNSASSITHYRIITPAKPPEPEGKEIDPSGTQMWTEQKLADGRILRCRVTAFGPNGPVPFFHDAPEPEVTFKYPLLKDPEPEMPKTHEDYTGPAFAAAIKPEPDLITLRLECLKLAGKAVRGVCPPGVYPAADDWTEFADALLHYVLNGSVDKA
jgi:hypothetical protein